MAEMKTVIVGEDHVKLFNTIAVEISAKCNRKCSFCPVSVGVGRAEEYMGMDMFEKILGELAELKYHDSLAYHIYNEPTADKRLPELIKLTRSVLGRRVSLRFSTNGDYFRSEIDIWKYFAAGLDQMLINVYSNERRYQQLIGMVGELVLVEPGLNYHGGGGDVKHVEVLRKFDEHLVQLKGTQKLQNRSGLVPKFLPARHIKKYCVRPARHANINWRGDMILCCNDYRGSVVIGNVAERTLVDLWNDPVMMVYRARLKNSDRRMVLCDGCDYGGGMMPYSTNDIEFGFDVLTPDMSNWDVEAIRAYYRDRK